MAWTMGSRRVVRVLGWLVPALATLITPSALAQNPMDLAHGVESQVSVQRSDANLGHPALDAVPTPIRVKRQVIVSVPDRKLVVMQNGAVLRVFEVAVGAEVSPSPSGTFEIVSRLTEPTYYHAGVVIPAGDDNPLGPRWVGLNKKGYGIHGTNAPRSIGWDQSGGGPPHLARTANPTPRLQNGYTSPRSGRSGAADRAGGRRAIPSG